MASTSPRSDALNSGAFWALTRTHTAATSMTSDQATRDRGENERVGLIVVLLIDKPIQRSFARTVTELPLAPEPFSRSLTDGLSARRAQVNIGRQHACGWGRTRLRP